ncbi:gamma-glutamylcyclotransferase [Mucilaginibacter sp. BT774]|uniref:gamma-glutamylcyclotransferase family protein n=1 Tax=Mucilaginibacter sp. BT774 TaxID=3062276 RepID=UPI0026771F47|nr:gamma-glutamylcyclotransferase family protein [Mucilaginibacter sp. BT774]MDO3625277.1 gamma-glutamylcyclotransferase family protein [Mucilaginibacter sp. BT774]
MKSALLFVYGTLLNHNNEFAVYLKEHSHFYANGKVRGKLYDIGEYPGAILDKSDEYIYGVILQIDDPEVVFSEIDNYEGYGDEQPEPNEFIRVSADVETASEIVPCYTYVYNLPIDSLEKIEGGRYVK